MGERVVSARLQPIVPRGLGPPRLKGILVAVVITLAATAASSRAQPAWEACFTPGGECTKAIVTALENTKSSVLVRAYTSAPIAKALLEASRRQPPGPRSASRDSGVGTRGLCSVGFYWARGSPSTGLDSARRLAGSRRDCPDLALSRSHFARRGRLSRWGCGQVSSRDSRTALGSRCGQRGPAASTDRDAARRRTVTGPNGSAMPTAAPLPTSAAGSSGASSTTRAAAGTAACAAATARKRRTRRENEDCCNGQRATSHRNVTSCRHSLGSAGRCVGIQPVRSVRRSRPHR